MDLVAYIGSRIKHLRINHPGGGLSQEELAAVLKITNNTISRWETGTYKLSIQDLQRLSRAC